MQEIKARNEMDPAYQWDLTHLFKTKQDWENAYKEAEGMIPEIGKLRSHLAGSAEELERSLSLIDRISEKVELVGAYAFLSKAGDGGDPEAQEMNDRATRLYVQLSTATAFLEPELLTIDDALMKEYMQDPALASHRHYLDDVSRRRAHTLSADAEAMLAALGDAAQTPSVAFDMLTNVDMEFPVIRDEDGNEHRLSNGNFAVFRESKCRRVREDAFEGYFGTYAKYINTTAALYAGSVKVDTYYASMHRHDSACEQALFSNNVPISVYDSLIQAVHDGLSDMKRYLALRKKTLGLDRLDVYDLYVPMVEDVEYPMPYEDAKQLVRRALAPLGEDYCKVLDRAFAERWIDVYENKGKESGAFSAGVYGVHPYVKLNYTDTLDDAYTLAHELGHAMHSYYSSETQDYANHDYRIMVAEVASTVNEVLLTKYLLSTETEPRRRAYILNHFLESFRTTVFRQTLFAEFERRAHDMYNSGVSLTASSLSDLYGELESTYYAGAEMRDTIKYEWSYIPHFYNAFYVYQYATGFSSAVAIADAIIESGDAGDYRRFLTLGGSDYPIEELKVAGVDLSSPETVKRAIDVFGKTITELSDLLDSLS